MGVGSSISRQTAFSVVSLSDSDDESFIPSSAQDGETWVCMRAKTSCKQPRQMVKKSRFVFQPNSGGFSLGHGEGCNARLEDSNLSAMHARIRSEEDGSITFNSLGRTYYLIGQAGRETIKHELEAQQIIKLGACSLQVAETCISRTASNFDPWAKHKPLQDNAFCYICYDEVSTSERELIPSPCSCGTPVHRDCLTRWIASKGSRACSICKTKLPIEFTVQPPYIVLQVVRHMRGLHWTGEREYIISFGERPHHAVTIGSDASCDLYLPDPSLSRKHCRVSFQDGHFYVEDQQSSAGTFVRLSGQHTLSPDHVSRFKMGRTLLSIQLAKQARTPFFRRLRRHRR